MSSSDGVRTDVIGFRLPDNNRRADDGFFFFFLNVRLDCFRKSHQETRTDKIRDEGNICRRRCDILVFESPRTLCFRNRRNVENAEHVVFSVRDGHRGSTTRLCSSVS